MGGLHEIKGRDRVDVRGHEDGLVVIAVVTAVGVGDAGHIAAATGSTVAIIVHRAVLVVEGVSTQIVHKLAVGAVGVVIGGVGVEGMGSIVHFGRVGLVLLLRR